MKIATNIFGLFDYTVDGEREDEAAAEIEKCLNFISRSGGAFTGMDAHDTINRIAEKYSVKIGTTV